MMRDHKKRAITNDIHSAGNGVLDVSSSHCSRFSRRNDLNVFNMANYMSCENCRHSADDGRCIAYAGNSIGSFE
ncbi:MAG: hypothetical protein FWD00_02430 [Clostridiales bacterium]|nr:hypothetical protein [Clostridiales bacterium]